MAKISGLGWTTCSVDDSGGTARAIINDVTALTIGMPRATQDVTGLDKSAFERLLLLADFSIGIEGVFNNAATTGIHTVLKNFGTILAGQVGRTVSLAISGSTLAVETLFTDYALSRAASGELTSSSPGVLADGTVPAWAGT